MGFLWDVLVPGGLMRRREARQQKEKVLDDAVDATLAEFHLAAHPPTTVALSLNEFKRLLEAIRAKLAPYNSKFSAEDVVNAIKDRGYGIKPAEPKKGRIPVWLVIGAILAIVLIKRKEGKR